MSAEQVDDLGVGVTEGVPVPFIWERSGKTVRIMLVGDQASDLRFFSRPD